MKIVLQYRASPGFRARFAGDGATASMATAAVDEMDADAFAREAADAEVLFHVLKPVTAEMIDQAPRLKLIQKLGVGVNTIDLDAARARGVAVCNMPGVNSQAVAEMTLALILAVLRRLTYFDPLVRRGEGWLPELAVLDRVGEVGGRTVGLLGYGDVPRRLAPVLASLGADVIYAARNRKAAAVGEFVAFEDLLERSDILSLHAPLTEQTRGILSREALGRMKPGAILINTARGELVDQQALAEALAGGRLAGAGLDVFAGEPIGQSDPLLSLPNVVLTPHVAWLTPETLGRSLTAGFENCRRLVAGEPLNNRVV